MQTAAFSPRVYRIEPPTRRFSYLVAPDGDWLGCPDGRSVATQARVDDAAIWEQATGGFRHVASGLLVAAGDGAAEGTVRLSLGDVDIGADGAAGAGADYRPAHGPTRLPSDYLADFRAQGWVALECVLPPDVVDGLQRLGGVDAYEGEPMDRSRHLQLDPAMARSTVEPLSLWLCRQYMRVDDIKLGHPPSVTALTPDDGERAVQGWHGDFPYMWGSERSRLGYRAPPGSDELVLAVQRNICVSDFRLDNGATVFSLASFKTPGLPPEAWGRALRTYRPGDRQENGLPYGGEGTDVIEAPAGTILLYDARIWHRAGMNMTNRRRGAVIQAITPGFIIPFMPMGGPYRLDGERGPGEDDAARATRDGEPVRAQDLRPDGLVRPRRGRRAHPAHPGCGPGQGGGLLIGGRFGRGIPPPGPDGLGAEQGEPLAQHVSVAGRQEFGA